MAGPLVAVVGAEEDSLVARLGAVSQAAVVRAVRGDWKSSLTRCRKARFAPPLACHPGVKLSRIHCCTVERRIKTLVKRKGRFFMLSAASRFSEADRKRINECVGAAESKTSAEIVPVVATTSGRYDRAEDLVGLWSGIVLMILTAVFWPAPPVSMESGSWDKDPSLLQAGKLIIAILVGFMLGVAAGSRIGSVRRMFTPAKQMREEVQQSARAIFFDKRIHHTESGSGLLIYISLFEHIAVILADQQVLKALGQGTLDELCSSLTAGLKENSATDSICRTIETAAEKLAVVLPGQSTDVNELPDSLITIG